MVAPVEPAPEAPAPPGPPGPREQSFAFWVVVAVAAFVGILLALTVDTTLGLGAAAVVIAFVEVIRKPRDAVSLLTLVLCLALLIPARLVFVPLGGTATPATLTGLLLLWYWVVARIVPKLGLDFGRQPMRIALLVWLWTLLASVAAAYARAGIPPNEMSATNRGIVVSAAAVGIALIAADGIANFVRLEALVTVIVWLGAVVAAIGIIQFVLGIDLASYIRIPRLGSVTTALSLGDRDGFRRVGSTATHPIEYAAVLAALFPLALHYGTFATRRHIRWIPAVTVGLAIPGSLSRTAVVAFAVVLAFLVPTWTWTRRTKALIIAIIGLAIAQVTYPGLLRTFVNLFTGAGQDISVTTRTEDYSEAIPFITSSPFFGRGIRTFDPLEYFFVDNQYLLQLIETGLVGLVATVALLVIGITLARGARHRSTDPAARDLGQAFAASIAALAVCGATFDLLSFPMVTIVLFVLLGASAALWRITCDDQAERAGDTDLPRGARR